MLDARLLSLQFGSCCAFLHPERRFVRRTESLGWPFRSEDPIHLGQRKLKSCGGSAGYAENVIETLCEKSVLPGWFTSSLTGWSISAPVARPSHPMPLLFAEGPERKTLKKGVEPFRTLCAQQPSGGT